MRRRLIWALFALLTAVLAPIGCSAGNAGVGGGGEQNIFAPTVTGNVICFDLPACEPIYIVITGTPIPTGGNPTLTTTPTATVTPTATITPTATRTPTPLPPTPSMVTVVVEITPISNPEKCAVEPYAERVKGTYEYKDYPNYGVGQNIRTGPGVTYPIVSTLPKTLPKNSLVTIFWLKWIGGARWVALNNECTRWVNGELGILDFD